jgi:hypothetical protein
MSMEWEPVISVALRRQALRAARAVAMGGAVVALSLGCGNTTSGAGGGTDTTVVSDSSTTGADSEAPAPCDPTVADGHCPSVCNMSDDVDCCTVGEGGWENSACTGCNDTKDGKCPAGCDMGNDADCCEEGGGGWAGGGCAVPGPFVAPAMVG